MNEKEIEVTQFDVGCFNGYLNNLVKSSFISQEFIVNTKEPIIIFDVSDELNEVLNNIKFFYSVCRREILNYDYLYCLDKNGKKITLYSGSISIESTAGYTIKKIKVIWNRMLIGIHAKNDKTLKLSSIEYSLSAKIGSASFHDKIGNDSFFIENNTIEVNTISDFGRAVFILKCKNLTPFSALDASYNLLIEIYFLIIGFFGDVQDTFLTSEHDKQNKLEFYTSGKLTNHSRDSLFINSSSLYLNPPINFTSAYSIWKKNRANSIFMELFKSTHFVDDNFSEVYTFNCIACLEGYGREIHNKKIPIKKGFREEHLRELLLRLFLDYGDANFVFQYEQTNQIYDKFIDKTINHRNMFAHAHQKSKYFIEDENFLAYRKLSLIFRIILLKDIGIKIDYKTSQLVIDDINTWYSKNKLS